ncbi:MAG: Secretion system C-terminal sorting domain [Bacteroidetes bacterium]|jgi:hypothetical protein|nr:Secretion system C-terminal sorting domain [Bacteroidota bacterium]
MKRFLSFVLVSFCITVKAQYTITSASNPVAGDVQSMIYMSSASFSMPVWGQNKFWNYSNLTTSFSSPYTNTFVSTSGVPNISTFNGATNAVWYGGNSYDIWKYTSSERTFLGWTNISGTTTFSNPVTYLTLPFKYGSGHSDTYGYSNSTTKESGNIQSIGAGTGTLALPGYTLNNTVVVEVTFSGAYTYSSASSTSSYSYTVKETSFYSAASKFPLMTISISGETGQPLSNDTSVSVNSLFAPVGITEYNPHALDFNIYPNPSKDKQVNIFFPEAPAENPLIEIYDISGRKVKKILATKEFMPDQIFTFSFGEALPGIYFIRVETSTGDKVKKLVVE